MNQDASHQNWIDNLITGTVSADEQAARAAFRATAPRSTQPAVTSTPIGVKVGDVNTWAVSQRSDGFTSFVLLDGPGAF
jgi:hypothetical protein